MAKYALLIGVSDYESNKINSLPGVRKDIEAMQRILQQPEIGGFNDVELLTDPNSGTIQSAIQRLFIEKCQEDDIALLYFSGHGWRDANRFLYFLSNNSRVYSQNQVLDAVSARFIQEECMNRSQAGRQVLILDCCFSGAFAEGMSAKDLEIETVDLAGQLGGEGRAILTSSTATQVSFEDGIGGGIYTRHLVEGIEKGAADTDNDGVITVAELDEYAKRKVQEAKPAMKPEIFAVREGYTIKLAQAPVDDNKLKYRQEVELCVKNDAFLLEKNRFKRIARNHLNFKQQEFPLNPEEAKAVEEEVLQPIREFQLSLQKYEQNLLEALEDEPVLSDGSWNILKRFQESLKLRDQDVQPIHEKLNIINQNNPNPPSLKQKYKNNYQDDLVSEKGVDYTPLRNLLKAKNWREADQETERVMLKVANREEAGYLDVNSINNFPCADLRTIDQLWVKYSNGHFGFSVQKRIYQSLGGTKKYDKKIWEAFGDRVGWRKEDNWLHYNDITFTLTAPEAHLPVQIEMRGSLWEGEGLGFLYWRWGGCESFLKSIEFFGG
ncbi:caspase, EACC1-associated type [Calothrix sp. CCY 0018]|uniref:caspase, EACC1-associated type n=1 Tax=Calothrix sp. CCY 0018 TaxID=3103864 RepID=UPI0039C5F168